MTSWYHFSRSRAGSRTGPPGSCCSIWREMWREKGGRVKSSQRERRAEIDRSAHPCLHCTIPPPTERGLQTLGDPTHTLAESWQLRDALAAHGASKSRRKRREATEPPSPAHGLRSSGQRSEGCAGWQEPGLPLGLIHSSPLPLHPHHLPGSAQERREGTGAQTSAGTEGEERGGRGGGGAAQPEDEGAGGAQPSREAAGAWRPPRMPESCSTVRYWAERSRLNREKRL